MKEKGFIWIVPLVVLVSLIVLIGIAAWSPWVSTNFAYNRIKNSIKLPCKEFTPTFLGELGPPRDNKVLFGRAYFFLIDCPSSELPLGNGYFVSFLGTVHLLSSSPNETWGTKSLAPNKDETTNWKTYQGDGYSLKYPPSWSIDSSGALMGRDKVIRRFSVYTETTSFTGNLEDWCKRNHVFNDFPGIKRMNVDGMDVYQISNTDERGANTPATWTYLQHGSNIYQVYWNISALDPLNYKFSDLVKEFNDPIFDKILSTFKFLN